MEIGEWPRVWICDQFIHWLGYNGRLCDLPPTPLYLTVKLARKETSEPTKMQMNKRYK